MLLVLPAISALAYVLLRKLLIPAVTIVNVCNTAVFGVFFTLSMLLTGGSVTSITSGVVNLFSFPLYPGLVLLNFMDQAVLIMAAAFANELLMTWVSLLLQKRYRTFRSGLMWVTAIGTVVLLLFTVLDTRLYLNRPEKRYSGHGFSYMNGWSSTDFSDYMVYSEPGKLAKLDHPSSFVIEEQEEMPVMDGAEACFPLYSAIAKAVYKDIDKIELQYQKFHPQTGSQKNGKVVSFTNTIMGFERLIMSDTKNYGKADLFFGARPSQSQLEDAKASDVELQITPIGKEAFVFFVEPDNPVSDLSSEDIRKIYSGEITNWSELGGKNQKITAFQRPENSGSQTMMKYFMGDTPLQEPKTYETIAAMEGVVKNVAQYNNEKGAMGYSFRYFVEDLQQENNVKLLSVDGVQPTIENIENGSYPLTVDLCLITRANDKNPNPNIQKMVDYCLSEEGQELIRKTGYAGLSE